MGRARHAALEILQSPADLFASRVATGSRRAYACSQSSCYLTSNRSRVPVSCAPSNRLHSKSKCRSRLPPSCEPPGRDPCRTTSRTASCTASRTASRTTKDLKTCFMQFVTCYTCHVSPQYDKSSFQIYQRLRYCKLNTPHV